MTGTLSPEISLLLHNMAYALVVFILGWFAIGIMLRGLDKLLQLRYPDAILRAFLLSVCGIGARVILLTSCLDMIGISIASILTALGALGLALGLAMQESLGNLAQGVVILFSRPFNVGDYVEIDGSGGIVTDMSLLHVTLSTLDQKRISLTNSQVAKAKIINHSAFPERCLELVSEVSANEDTAKVIVILKEAIAAAPLAMAAPAPVVLVSGISNDLVQITARIWVANDAYWDLYLALLSDLRARYTAAGVAIPDGKQLLRVESAPLPGKR